MRFSPRNTCVIFAVTTALLLGTVALAQDGRPQPARIGELETVEIATPHPYPVGWGSAAQQWIIEYPGATYIRVHFSQFDLAPGDSLEIFDLFGARRHTYTGRGPHGTGDFWAFTVPGDTAIVRLEAPVGSGFGFVIDGYGRGTQSIFDVEPGDPGEPPAPESVCGSQDWMDVECYRDTRPTEFGNAEGAVRAIIGCCTGCTAFKISDSGQFLTNNHCTASQSGVRSTELQMKYQNNSCGGGGSSDAGSVMGQDLLATDFVLDYTLMSSTGNSSAIPCLPPTGRTVAEGERLYIAHHPSAGVKKLSIESDFNGGGDCQVDDYPHPGNAANTDVGYYCDTTNGSSGSPVLDGNNEVIAIHHFGGCLNSGVRMDLILDDLPNNTLDPCDGGPQPTCGDGTCDAGENECSCAADCGMPPGTETSCTDGVDNDCDGDVDCNDADCSTDPACEEPPPTCYDQGQSCSSHGDCCPGLKCKGGRGGKTCR